MGEAGRETKRALVLVVDDEEAMLEVYQDTLARLGVEVIAKRDPREAAALVAANGRFDLALLDLRMPHVDGLTLLEQIRESHPDTPVIVSTGYPSKESAERCRQLGALHYIRKPFDPEDLLRHVRRVLGGSNADTNAG